MFLDDSRRHSGLLELLGVVQGRSYGFLTERVVVVVKWRSWLGCAWVYEVRVEGGLAGRYVLVEQSRSLVCVVFCLGANQGGKGSLEFLSVLLELSSVSSRW